MVGNDDSSKKSGNEEMERNGIKLSRRVLRGGKHEDVCSLWVRIQ